MSERYDPDQIRMEMNEVMTCSLEVEGVPGITDEALKLVPELYAVSKKDARTLYENIGQLGKYMAQMGQLIGRMQHRLDEMEARQAAVTVSHAEVKRIQARIRMRAEEICEKYQLTDGESPKIFRAAIKKELLKRFLVKDLHDLPAAALGQAETLAGSWTNIRLIMERRSGG